MLDILISLNAHNYHIFQPILMILVSKFIVYKALSYKTYLSLGLLSPLIVAKCMSDDFVSPQNVKLSSIFKYMSNYAVDKCMSDDFVSSRHVKISIKVPVTITGK